MNFNKDMVGSMGCASEVLQPYIPSIKERVANQLKDAESRVAELKELQSLLQEEPTLERTLTLASKLNY